MNPVEAASPPQSPLGPRRATLRARPSGLKGRCRDRCATDLRPALDPGASTAPHRIAGASPLPAGSHGARLLPRSNPYKQSLYDSTGLPSRPLLYT